MFTLAHTDAVAIIINTIVANPRCAAIDKMSLIAQFCGTFEVLDSNFNSDRFVDICVNGPRKAKKPSNKKTTRAARTERNKTLRPILDLWCHGRGMRLVSFFKVASTSNGDVIRVSLNALVVNRKTGFTSDREFVVDIRKLDNRVTLVEEKTL